MMNARIQYDAQFVGEKFLNYKGSKISSDITIMFEVKYEDFCNNEIFVVAEDEMEDECPCEIYPDTNKGINFIEKKKEQDRYCIINPVSAYIQKILPNGDFEPIEIAVDDALKLLKDNYDTFDNPNNYPAENTGNRIHILD